MNSILYTIILAVLWIANLFNGTGLGLHIKQQRN